METKDLIIKNMMTTYNAEQLSDYLDLELNDSEITLMIASKFCNTDIINSLKEEYFIGNMIHKNELILMQISKQLISNNVESISKDAYLNIIEHEQSNEIEVILRF